MKSSWAWLFGAVLLGGCSSWNPMSVRSQSPDDPPRRRRRRQLVGDLAVPYGMFPVQVEAVGLVTGLHGTGSDPAPSPQRAALLDEMQTRGVKNPERRAGLEQRRRWCWCRACCGRAFRRATVSTSRSALPSQSETTSLRGGYLLETRLTRDGRAGQSVPRRAPAGAGQGPVHGRSRRPRRKEDRVMLVREAWCSAAASP